MSVSIFTSPNCNYCSLQKDCKIKLDKSFNDNLFKALKDVTLPNGIGIELNCVYFLPNKDAFKIRIKENGDIESLGMNKGGKVNMLCPNCNKYIYDDDLINIDVSPTGDHTIISGTSRNGNGATKLAACPHCGVVFIKRIAEKYHG